MWDYLDNIDYFDGPTREQVHYMVADALCNAYLNASEGSTITVEKHKEGKITATITVTTPVE